MTQIDGFRLARHARRALADTRGGTLSVDGIGEPDPPAQVQVLLYDEDGEPRFLCEAGSALADAAEHGRAAVLEVGCCRHGGCRRQVRFAGRLALLDTDDVGGTPVHVVGLALQVVQVGEPDDEGVDVPLAGYRAEPPPDELRDEPDTDGPRRAAAGLEALAGHTERVTRHTNEAHAAQVRAAAGTLSGTDPHEVIAAQLTALDEHGFELEWVTRDGAHRTAVSFPRPARSPDELATLLRAALTPH